MRARTVEVGLAEEEGCLLGVAGLAAGGAAGPVPDERHVLRLEICAIHFRVADYDLKGISQGSCYVDPIRSLIFITFRL